MKNLLTSRSFWVAMLMLVVVVISAFVPSFDLDTETAAGLGVIVMAYILGITVDPGPGGWRGVLLSRKFWAAAVGLTVMILNGFGIGLPFGLSQDQIILFILTITGLIAGPAVERLVGQRAEG
jgi:hypothetical protein